MPVKLQNIWLHGFHDIIQRFIVRIDCNGNDKRTSLDRIAQACRCLRGYMARAFWKEDETDMRRTAVEGGGKCRDVVTQLAAVSSALDRAGFAIIATAMKDCLADPDATERTDDITTEELEKLFLALA